MAEQGNAPQGAGATGTEPGKNPVDQAPQNKTTFSQADVDAIVSDRLARERAKYAGFEDYKKKAEAYDKAKDAEKTELEKAQDKAQALQMELDGLKKANAERELRAKVSAATGVPASLLTGATEEELTASAKAINAYAGRGGYPGLKDGGELTHPAGSKTRDIFAGLFS